MAHSQVSYTGDGSTVDFNFTFDSFPPGYNNETEVKVYVDGDLLTITTHYSLFGPNTIRFVTAPILGAYILIERQTDFVNRPNAERWNNTSALTQANHNTEDDGSLRRAQENKDNRGLPKSRVHGQWDAQNLRGTTAADPVNSQDWVTLKFMQDYISGGETGAVSMYRQTYSNSLDLTYPVDGVNREFRIIDDLAVKMTIKDQIHAFIDGEFVGRDQYELTTDKYGILFDVAPPCKSLVELIVHTVALTFVEPGTLNPNALSLDNGKIIQGNVSNQGVAVALGSISLSSWGAAAASVDFGNQKGINVATPAASTDAATKGYVDSKSLAGPFGTVSSENAYTFTSGTSAGQVIQNTSGGTEFININMVISVNQSTGRNYVLQYADDEAMTANLKRAATVRVTSAGEQPSDTFAGLIPAGKYWRLAITSGPNHPNTGITFDYQKGGNA